MSKEIKEQYIHPNDGRVTAIPAGRTADTSLPEHEQDQNIAGTFPARPGAQDSAPQGMSATGGLPSSGPADQGTFAPQSATGTHGVTGTGYPHVGTEQSGSSVGRGLAGSERSVGQDTELSARQQDSNLAGSFAARPGAKDATPAGLSGTTHHGTPEVNNSALPASVKSSLDSVADTAAPKSVADQLPSAEGIKEQLPTTQQATETAQQAAESVARGASSLISGISNLVLGAGNATSETAAQTHPESARAKDVDDLHIPGAFASETSDREDLNAVKQSLPDADTARKNVTGSERPIVDQASDAARSAQRQVPDANTARANVTGSERPLVDQASDAARSAQVQAQQGLNYAKEQVLGQTSSSTGSGLNAPASSQAQAPSQTTSSGISSVLPSGPSTLGQTQPTVTTGIASAEAPKVSVKDGPGAREVPDMVAESHRKAGETAPLDLPAYNAGEEQHKRAALGQTSTGTVGSSTQSSSGPGIGGAIAGGLAAAGTAVAGAAEYARQQTHQATGTDPVTILPESAQKAIDPQTAANTSDPALQRGEAPGVVQASQRAAGVGPEASANPFAVQEKNDVEAELKREISPAQASSENKTVTGALAGAGATISRQIPDANTARANITGSERPITEQITGSSRPITEQISQQLPDANTARANVTGSEKPVTEQISKSLPDANTARANVTGSERPLVDQASDAAARAHQIAQQAYNDPASVLPASINPDASTGSYPSIPSNHQTESHLTSSSGPEPGTGVAPLDFRPAHAGTASGIPRNTVESSAAPDVSYEHRPKTLPQSEIVAREQERANTTTHQPIAFQPVSGAIHSDISNPDLHSGVHNGVVGVGSAHPLDASQHGAGAAGVLSHATSAQPRDDAVVGHIRDDLEHVDLSKGVRNTVVGAGAREGGGQDERTL